MLDKKTELLKALLAEEQQEVRPMNKLLARERSAVLRELFATFSEKHQLAPGMLVKWKQGLRNKKKPSYDEPAIVIEILDSPVIGKSDESGSSYFREPLDLIAGFLDDDGDFVVFHYDSRRFMPFSQ